jgi:hypothetical protein
MTEFLYRRLIEEVCIHEGLPDPQRIYNGDRLLIDGHEVSLLYDAMIDPGVLYMTVDFGALPERHALMAYRAMLEANLMLAAIGMGVLALDPATDHPVFAGRMPLTPELTAAQFADMLKQCVAHGRQWQQDLAASACEE